MKSLTKYPPLVRMTYMSIAKTTPMRKRKPSVLLWVLPALLFWYVVVAFFLGPDWILPMEKV